MDHGLNSTVDYHRSRLETLGWELTVCNALEPPDSPCRKVLLRDDSYGHLLYDYLSQYIRIERLEHVIEIGGGYGYLMRDFIEKNPAFRATMLDISPVLLAEQRETLRDYPVHFRLQDFLSIDEEWLEGFELAIMNENLGDFPTLLNLSGEFFELPAAGMDDLLKKARYYFDLYALPPPSRDLFHLNIGALAALEKLCIARVPVIFLGEHSCEAKVPASLQRMITVNAAGTPERISLAGHDEYSIAFSLLEKIALAWDYAVVRGPFADFLPFTVSDRLRFILTSPFPGKDEYEIIRHFIGDLFQYEYLFLMRHGIAPIGRDNVSPQAEPCARCGKCCLTDFIAYVTEEDMLRWTQQGRSDILDTIGRERAVWMGDHLVSSDSGASLHACPFLVWQNGLHSCTIYETRPAVCRAYKPGSSELCSVWKKHGEHC